MATTPPELPITEALEGLSLGSDADKTTVQREASLERAASPSASSESSSSTVWNEASITPHISKEELVAKAIEERTAKRRLRSLARNQAGNELKDQGKELFKAEKYREAVSAYGAAIEVNGANPVYLSNMAAAFLKLKDFQEAEDCASRALMQDPKSVKARYRRAVARKELGLFHAAQIDFQTVLDADPTNTDAAACLQAVNALRSGREKMKEDWEATQTTKYPYDDEPDEAMDGGELAEPAYEADPVEIQSMSDSSDCNHHGHGSSFGFPCRFYNHNGCSRGKACSYSHAPDSNSVRDRLGRNICIYYLLGTCKFGSVKCVYSHSRDCLPTVGWWNDPVLTEKVRVVKDVAQASEREQRALDGLLKKLQHTKQGGRRSKNPTQTSQSKTVSTRKKGPAPSKKGKGNPSTGGRGRGHQPENRAPRAPNRVSPQTESNKLPTAEAGSRPGPSRRRSPGAQLRHDEELVERDINGGFTDYELNELLSQGVKPWDDDAWDVLAALRY